MDFETSLRRAIKTGNVVHGQKSTKDCIEKGTAQLVVVAKNSPEDVVSFIADKPEVFMYTYKGSSMQLGKACGRPHMVSALAVVDAGESDILNLKRA